MKAYHFTSVNNLESISKKGLVPGNGDNSKLIDDQKEKVFFSEGFEGVIALYVDFNLVFENIKLGKSDINDLLLQARVDGCNSLKEYLGEGVYLTFELGNIKNERNFEKGCTSMIIEPSKLKVVGLKNEDKISFSMFDVVNYMMANTLVSNIKYYGVKYLNSPVVAEATKRIQGKVSKYYQEHDKDFLKYKAKEYSLIEVDLVDFVKERFDGDSCIFNKTFS